MGGEGVRLGGNTVQEDRVSLRTWKVKRARLGAVYSPRDNLHYMYVVVSLKRSRLSALLSTIHCLQLVGEGSWGRVIPGVVWEEPLDEFERSLLMGTIRRIG